MGKYSKQNEDNDEESVRKASRINELSTNLLNFENIET